MRGLCWVLLAGCYAPHATPGAPCDPAHPSCPDSQTCQLANGSYVCAEGTLPLPGLDAPIAPDVPMPGDDAMMPPSAWTLIQTPASESTRNTTLAPTGAGHVIVVAFETANAPVASVRDDVGNAYVTADVRAVDRADNIGVELWYAADSKPGATTVTVDVPTIYATSVWEVSAIRTSAPLDVATKLDDQPTTTMPLGAPVTTSTPGEFVVSVAIVANQVSGIHAGNEFTNDHKTFGNGWAHLTDPAAPAATHVAQWDQPTSGAYCASSAAFFVGP
jgi:hypothetical protein